MDVTALRRACLVIYCLLISDLLATTTGLTSEAVSPSIETSHSSEDYALQTAEERTFGYGSFKNWLLVWRRFFLWDILWNVLRVGGSALLFAFAPNLYQQVQGQFSFG